MSDEILGGSALSVDSSSVSSPSVSSAPEQTASVSQPVPARTFTQQEVNELIGRNKRESYERGKRDSTVQPVNSFSQQDVGTQQSSQQQNASTITPELQKIIDERASHIASQTFNQHVQQNYSQQTKFQYIQKLEGSKAEFPDFDQKVAALNLPASEELIPLLNSVDPSLSAAVIHDMALNPAKFANLKILNMMNPQLAAMEYNKLVESVKKNREALAQKSPNDPLTQIKSSVTGLDSGQLSVSDLRRLPQYQV